MSLPRFLVLVAVALVALIFVAVRYFPSPADFRDRNVFWNGMDEFAARYGGVRLSSLKDLPGDPSGTVLLLIPTRDVVGEDLSRVKDYVEGGGILVLGDDRGFGNTVLDTLGLPVRFSGHLLMDSLFRDRARWFPLIYNFEDIPLTAGIEALEFNYGTALEGDGFEVIARSSPFSYLDVDGNEERDVWEPAGPLPVIGQVKVGSGMVVLLSDPSVLINVMIDRRDNERFAENIADLAGPDAAVYLDETYLPLSRVDQARRGLAPIRRVVANPPVLAGLVVVVVTAAIVPPWRRKGTRIWPNRN